MFAYVIFSGFRGLNFTFMGLYAISALERVIQTKCLSVPIVYSNSYMSRTSACHGITKVQFNQ